MYSSLIQSEENYRILLDAIPDLMMRFNRDGICLDFRLAQNFQNLMSEQDWRGKHITEMTPLELVPQRLEAMERALETGEVQVYEQSITVDQKRFYEEVQVVRCAIDEVLIIVRDVSDRKAAELALHQSEYRFQRLAANIPGTLYQFRLEATGGCSFPYVSAFSQELVELEPEIIQQQAAILIDQIHPDDCDSFQASVMRSAETLEPWEWTGRFILPSGKMKWLQAHSRPELQTDGAIVWDGLLIDVSERKAAELALQQTEIQYRGIFEAVSDAILIRDLETGMLVDVNPAACQMYGYSRDELLALKSTDTIHPDSLSVFKQMLEAVRSGSCFSEQAINVRKDGSFFDVEMRASCYVKGGKTFALSTVRDISDRKRADAAIAESEARFRSFVENANDLIYSLSREGIFTYLSPKSVEVIGFTPSELMGKSLLSFVHSEDAAIAAAFLQQILETGEQQAGLEIRVKRKDESWGWLTCNFSPIKATNGAIVSLLGIARDITASKAAEAQLRQQAIDLEKTLEELQRTQAQLVQNEKMTALGQLVAGIAHEINNPVTFIAGNINHASDYFNDVLAVLKLYEKCCPSTAEIEESLEEIDLDFVISDFSRLLGSMRTGAERIQQIVLSLRTFSRLDEAAYKAVNIHEGIDSTLTILRSRIHQDYRGQTIEIVQNYSELPLVRCYAGEMNQVFLNVLSNAIDALEEAIADERWARRAIAQPDQMKPRIEIQTELADSLIRVRIKDNGLGIPPEIQRRIFDPFFTTKPVGKGTGMGLANCYQIVTEHHGGSLKCFSECDRGTEFVIEIPINQTNFHNQFPIKIKGDQ